jgi:uncharacterized protein (DUF58 family)
MRRYLPYLLVLFLVAAVVHVELYFTIAYLFIVIYLLGRLWLRRSLDGLRVTRRYTPRAFQGEALSVRLLLHNAGRLPIPWLELREDLPVELAAAPHHQAVLSLAAGERLELSYRLNCRKRGYYTLGPLLARSGDLLGLTEPGELRLVPAHLIVYPRVVPLPRLSLPTRSPLALLSANRPLYENPAQVIGVRQYRGGDSPRRIHWSASAHSGGLLVKQYQPAIARELVVALDLDAAGYSVRQRYDASELAITVAASLASHVAVREGLPVGLLTEARDPLADAVTRVLLPPRRERAHLMDLLGVLARVELAPAAPLEALLREAAVQLPWGATLVAVTPRPSAELFAALGYLRRRGFAVAVWLVQPERPISEWQPAAARLGLPVRRILSERDLEQAA